MSITINPPTGKSGTPTAFVVENPNVPILDNQASNEPNAGYDVVVREVSITLNSGAKIDMRGYFESVSITESMFNMKISGAVIVNDLVGALEKFEIRGGETLNLKILKPDSEEILIWREDLIVESINKHEVDVMSGNTKYQMVFCSGSFVESFKKTVFKSYKNIPLADAVQDLYSRMSVNDLIIEDPQLTLTTPFISTGLNPHRAIDRLAQRACGPLKYFVFFERFIPVTGQYIDGKPFAGVHYFGSIENIINTTAESGVKTLVFSPKTNANLEGSNVLRVSKFAKESNFNQLSAVSLGLNRTDFTYLNLNERTTSSKSISYADKDFFTTVSGDIYDTAFLDKTNKFYLDGETELGNRKVTTTKLFGTRDKADWLPYNIFGMLTKNYFKLSVVIQGATNNISVGSLVDFNVISYFERMMNATSGTPPLDEIYSGRYFVTGVTHIITQTNYNKTLELSRGSSRKTFLDNRDLVTKLTDTYPELAKLFTN